jgi:hypothetical protein
LELGFFFKVGLEVRGWFVLRGWGSVPRGPVLCEGGLEVFWGGLRWEGMKEEVQEYFLGLGGILGVFMLKGFEQDEGF